MTRVIQANSITLTPGTVTVSIEGDELLVHSLSKETLQALEGDEMLNKLAELEKNI